LGQRGAEPSTRSAGIDRRHDDFAEPAVEVYNLGCGEPNDVAVSVLADPNLDRAICEDVSDTLGLICTPVVPV
jgi:hypothetical protein